MSLQNFEKARHAMVVSQLQPSGIVDPKTDQAFDSVPREMFVPESLRGVCYLDDDLEIGHGRFLTEPLIVARMVQDARLTAADKVMDVGGGTGYLAAVLSQMAGEVISLEQNEQLLHAARQHWENLHLSNVTPVLGQHKDGYAPMAPYQAIFVNGAVAECPQVLMGQLAEGGRLYCVLQPEDAMCGKVMVYEKTSCGQIVARSLGDAATSHLQGLEPVVSFEF